MNKKIIVQTQDEFTEMAQNHDIRISEACVESILKNLNTKKRHIHILEVIVEEEDKIFDIICDRKDFVETLEKNLIIMEKHEEYEKCSEIIKALEILKSK